MINVKIFRLFEFGLILWNVQSLLKSMSLKRSISTVEIIILYSTEFISTESNFSPLF